MPKSTPRMLAATLLFALTGWSASVGAQQWKVTALDDPPGASGSRACGINNSGTVAGITTIGGVQRPIRWTKSNGTYIYQVLDVQAGTVYSDTCSINAGNAIASSNRVLSPVDTWTAARWDGQTPAALGVPQSYHSTLANGINANGTVVGYAHTRTGDLTSAVVWQGLSPTILKHLAPDTPQSFATSVNDAGTVTGWSFNGQGYNAVVWQGSGYSDSPVPLTNPADSRDSRGLAINNSGLVAGVARVLKDDSPAGAALRAFTWSGTTPNELPSLPPEPPRTDEQDSWPFAVNSSGDVVGQSAHRPVLWRNRQIVDLVANSDFVAKGWQPYGSATGINDSGQIVGTSSIAEKSRAFILDPGLQIEIVDPVPALLDGNAIAKNVETLSRGGRIVKGASADGVSQIVFRIRTKNSDQSIKVQIDTEQCQGRSDAECVDEYGLIFDPLLPIKDIFGNSRGQPLNIKSVPTPDGPMAFVAYRSPVDFARSTDPNHAIRDSKLAVRFVKILVGTEEIGLTIVRPPVVLVHGLWADPTDLGELKAAIEANPLFSTISADYGTKRINVYNLTPSSDVSKVSGSALGLKYGATQTVSTVSAKVIRFSEGENPAHLPVAAVQADIVAHSMGALVARYIQHLDRKTPDYHRYKNKDNFMQGSIHKIVSIGGPHLGSPFAMELLKRGRTQDRGETNECIREYLAKFEKQPLVTIDSYGTSPKSCISPGESTCESGAVADIAGSGDGKLLSPALTQLKSNGALRVAYIVGSISERAVAALSTTTEIGDPSYEYERVRYRRATTNIDALKLACRILFVSNDSLPHLMEANRFPELMVGDSDGIVPVISQRNNNDYYSDITSSVFGDSGVVHSGGGVLLGFGVIDSSPSPIIPTLLDRVVAEEVIRLLNISIRQPIYIKGQ